MVYVMQEIAAVLNRLSIAVQFAVVICLFAYFLLLWQMVKLREVRLWTLAWLADAVALAAVFVHAYATMPPSGHRMTLVLYLAGKAMRSMMFWVPQSARLGLGVSIISYAGEVRLGVATDSGLVPNPQDIIDAFEEEMVTMMKKDV